MVGDLTNNIGQAQKPLNQYVADLKIDFGLVDLVTHFQKRL